MSFGLANHAQPARKSKMNRPALRNNLTFSNTKRVTPTQNLFSRHLSVAKKRIVSSLYDEESSEEEEKTPALKRPMIELFSSRQVGPSIQDQKRVSTTIVDNSDDEALSSMKVTPTGSEGSPSDNEETESKRKNHDVQRRPIEVQCRSPKMSVLPARVDTPSLAKKDQNTPRVTCDRCDGQHLTEACPHFKKERDDHPDALSRKPSSRLGSDGGNAYLDHAEIIPQPGDGSCLFHSLLYGYKRLGDTKNKAEIHPSSASGLRSSIMDWLEQNENTKIADSPVKDWIRWDSNTAVIDYVRRMRLYGWGGGIEMAAFARKFHVEVHVYEKIALNSRFPFKRISRFSTPTLPDSLQTPGRLEQPTTQTSRVVNVVYRGGVHYDALLTTRKPVFLRPDGSISIAPLPSSPRQTAPAATPEKKIDGLITRYISPTSKTSIITTVPRATTGSHTQLSNSQDRAITPLNKCPSTNLLRAKSVTNVSRPANFGFAPASRPHSTNTKNPNTYKSTYRTSFNKHSRFF